MIQVAGGNLAVGVTAVKLNATPLLARQIVIVAADGLAPPNSKPIWIHGPSDVVVTTDIGMPIEPGQPFAFEVDNDPDGGGWDLSLITVISTLAGQKLRFAAYR